MAYTNDRTYDQIVSGPRSVLASGPGYFDGTASANIDSADGRVIVPFACKLLAVKRAPYSGATVAAASYVLIVGHSLAGTGTYTTLGTFTVPGTEAAGTAASGRTVATAASLTTTESLLTLAEGDVLSVCGPTATTAVIGTNQYWYVVQELPS